MKRSVKCAHSDPMCGPCKKEFTTPYPSMSNSTTDHAYKPNGYGVDKCLLCGEKITEHLTPMTLPDDIELREELEIRLCINGCQQRTAGYNEAKQGKKGLDTDDMERMETIAVNEVMELIAIYRKKWETEAYTNGFRAGAIDTLLELKSQVKAQGENK